MNEADRLWRAFTGDLKIINNAACMPIEIEGTKSRNYICRLWEGVYLWGNEIYEHFISEKLCSMWELNIAAINLCISGRCETALENDTFVYMSPGLLNINTNAPKNGYYYPGNLYEGLEIAFDLDVLADTEPECLRDLGLTKDMLLDIINNGCGSFMAQINDNTIRQAEGLYNALRKGELSLSDYRFMTVQLLYTLIHGGAQEIKGMQYATKGQRHIANEVEHKITAELSRKYTVEELAADHGISPSALKKYFEMVYGMPISHYLKAKRMDKARQLLATTKRSVREIANECGYENQGKFGTAFKLSVGILPLEYRRQNFRGRL